MEGRNGEASKDVMPYTYAERALIDVQITDRAVDYIAKEAKGPKPFFLYLPFTLPHNPPLAAPEFIESRRSQYQNVLAEIDANAGRVIEAVEKAGIADNTIIVFTSDNGPQTLWGPGIDYGGQSDSGPFRSEFPSGWEGAVRVPAIIRWPGHTTPGRVSNEIVSLVDFYRTFANVAGVEDRVPTDRAIDSLDQTAFMFGGQQKSARDSLMLFHGGALLAIKYRNFKIHFEMRDAASGPVVAAGQGVTHGVKTAPNYPWIFDVANDPKELWDIAPSNGWLQVPIARILGAYAKSVKEFPNLAPGSEGPEAK